MSLVPPLDGEVLDVDDARTDLHHAGFQGIAFGVGIERDEHLRNEGPQHIQAGARHKPELARDRLQADRGIALAKQPEYRSSTRDGGRLARPNGLGKLAIKLRNLAVRGAGRGRLVGHGCSIYRTEFYIYNNNLFPHKPGNAAKIRSNPLNSL